jgi:hypothetical protein
MGMRARTIGLVLLGLGAFLLVGALMVSLVLAPTLVRLPLDQSSSVVSVDEDATYLDRSELEEAEGPVIVNLLVEGDPGDDEANDDVAVWHYGTSITDEDGELIVDPSETINCLDRTNGEAVACDVRTAEIEGLTLTFPFGTEQRDYELWNGNIGSAVTARYAGEDSVEGVDVYRFDVSIPETEIDETEVPGRLAGSDEDMVTADVVYSNERTILVEPVSGKIVSSVESPNIVLQGPEGDTGATILSATFGPDDATLSANAADAADTRDQIRLVGTILPWVLGVLGALALVGGGLLAAFARRDTDDAPARHAVDRDDEQPATAAAAN